MHHIAVMVVGNVNVNGQAYRLQPVRRKKMRYREPRRGWDNLLQGCQGQTPRASRDPDGHRAWILTSLMRRPGAGHIEPGVREGHHIRFRRHPGGLLAAYPDR